MRAVRCARPPAPASTPAGSARAIADAALVVSLATLARVAGDGFAVNRLARHAVQTRPRLCRRRCRRARQPMPHRPPPRLRHRICLGASHRRRTLASRKRDTPRFSLRRPTQDRASRRRGRPLLRRAHRPHARACDDDDYNRDGVRALTSASGIVCGTSLPPDELRAPCARSASAPSPRSQDGLSRDLAHCVRPHDAVADPCTGQPIDGAPPLVTMTIAMMTVPPSVRHAEFLAATSDPRAPA